MFNIQIIDLAPNRSPIDMTGRTYDGLLDCPEALIAWACDIIQEEKAADFRITGFGLEARFPSLDFNYEGAMVIEDLPNALEALMVSRPFVISLMAQGLESELHSSFTDDPSVVTVHCRSYLEGWTPEPDSEPVDFDTLVAMLRTCGSEFIRIVRRLLPELHRHPLMQEWIHSFPPT